MTKRPSTWLAIASVAGIVGGGVSLVVMVCRDAASRGPIRLESGETVTIEYSADADAPHTFSSDERAAIAEIAARVFPEVRRALPMLPPSLVLRVTSARKDDKTSADLVRVASDEIIAMCPDAR